MPETTNSVINTCRSFFGRAGARLLVATVLLGSCLPISAHAEGRKADHDPSRRIDLGNGVFQLKLDPEVGTKTEPWLDGAIEWEYVGQAKYVLDEHAGPQRMLAFKVNASDDAATDTMTRLLHTEMEDEHGRLFRARVVDRQKLEQAVAAYEAQATRDFGAEPHGDPGRDANDADSIVGDFKPLSWSSNNDKACWDGDDRELCTAPLTARQEKVVAYFVGSPVTTYFPWAPHIPASNAYRGTGVLIGDRWVLTAAHVAMNSTGSAWRYPKGQVHTRGAGFYSGSQAANVVARWGNGNYSGDGDFGDDLVVMKIDQPLGAGNYMALSSASNSTLKQHTAYNIGYPGTAPSGSSNGFNYVFNSNGTADRDDDTWSEQTGMYWSSGDVTYTSTKVIGTRVDASSGHSGGPIFYYPQGTGSPASHYLSGILAGFVDGLTENYNGGPKIPYHRDWIIGIMSNN